MAFITIVVAAVWTGSGFLMVLYLAGLQNISADILEAGEIDGCTGFKKVILLQLPLLMPTITINLFVSIAGAFKSFDIPYAMTGGGPAGVTNTIALNIYKDAFSTYNMGYACAKSVVLFFIVMAITCIQLRFTRKKEVQL
jgi:raffinose/stachyose/melibiose transport system permease protein